MGPLRDLLHRYTEADLDKLSWMAFAISVIHLTLMWWTFIEQCNPVPEEFTYLLWVTLAVYAAPKEAVRWQTKGHPTKKRLGQVFVPIWFVSLCVMGFFEWKNPLEQQIPEGMKETVVGVLIIFGASIVSGKVHKYRRCPPYCDEENKEPGQPGTQDTTLDHGETIRPVE